MQEFIPMETIPNDKIDEIISWFNGKMTKDNWRVLNHYKRCCIILNKEYCWKHEDWMWAYLGLDLCRKFLPEYIKLSIKCAWYED